MNGATQTRTGTRVLAKQRRRHAQPVPCRKADDSKKCAKLDCKKLPIRREDCILKIARQQPKGHAARQCQRANDPYRQTAKIVRDLSGDTACAFASKPVQRRKGPDPECQAKNMKHYEGRKKKAWLLKRMAAKHEGRSDDNTPQGRKQSPDARGQHNRTDQTKPDKPQRNALAQRALRNHREHNRLGGTLQCAPHKKTGS